MSVVVLGLNHRTAALDLLERMTVPDQGRAKALHDLRSRPHVSEAVLLSTCNRIEVYVQAEKFHGAFEDVRSFFAEMSGLGPEAFNDHLYSHYDADGARHLFGVASGLDSAVLGETEILGQVRTAWELAQTENSIGPALSQLFRHAVETGKRVRTETSISRHITSVSQAAVAMAGDRLSGLTGRSVLLIGAGEMGEGLAVSLKGAGASDIRVVNRTWDTAVDLAERIDGTPVATGDLQTALADVDLMLTSTGATSLIVEHSELDEVAKARAGRPLLIVDIAVPRDVDPSAGELDGITLLDMDDLRAFADAGVLERRREVRAVRDIIDEEVERYLDLNTAREVEPLIALLYGRGEELRSGELDRFAARLDRLDPEQRELVEAMTRGLLGKLLHEPAVRLKDASGTARGDRLAEALRDLFDL
ncbi:MAG: glutamyl-tRNA reductase [Acidimicrobiales bacterium]